MKSLILTLAIAAASLAGCMQTEAEYMAALAARSSEYCIPGETMVEHTWSYHMAGSALCKDNATGKIASR